VGKRVEEYILSLNGEQIGISKGVTLEDIHHQSENWDKWEVLTVGEKYTFRNVHGQRITLEDVTGLESLKVGDYVDLDYTIED
jgi:hypothetical protein